jgi:hypothetical protein
MPATIKNREQKVPQKVVSLSHSVGYLSPGIGPGLTSNAATRSQRFGSELSINIQASKTTLSPAFLWI